MSFFAICSSLVFHFPASFQRQLQSSSSPCLFFSVLLPYPPPFCPSYIAFGAFLAFLGGRAYSETCAEDLKIAEVPEEERMRREGRRMEGDGRRECFRVSIDKWVCGVSRGSGEHRQLGQLSLRGTGKWGFYLPETPERGKGRG